jgi:carboxyl-terminal processing protease
MLNPKSKLSFYKLAALSVFILLLGGFKQEPGGDDDIYTKINKNMDVFGKMYKEIVLNYVDEIETDKFMKAGIEGMLGTLDPYTNFLDESRKDEVDLLTTGKYGGIGITIGMKDSAIIITDIMEGYSAQKEGLRRGDKILEIDGSNLTGRNTGDVRGMVRGTPGTLLKMKIMRGEKEMEFTLTRQEIKLKNISYSGMLEGSIGYIKLERFNKNAETEMIEALTELNSKGEIKGLIIDLRDNPGGLLDAALGILNKVLDKGKLLLTTKGRKPDSERKYFSEETPMVKSDIPLVLLVNQNSASASEIVAGAIQDLDRGVIIGTKTFGKGLVQVFTPLSYGSQLKITNQKYFTPSGRWIQSKNYFKENKYGVFKPNPYFNQTEFKTLGGRTVWAEGGITPDTLLSEIVSNQLLDELLNQDMYYKFAGEYTSLHTYTSDFMVNDDILNSFYSFLTREGFNYHSDAETELSRLKKTINKDNYSQRIKTALTELESWLAEERLNMFESSKEVMKKYLEQEILRRYNLSDSKIVQTGLKEDIYIKTALYVLSNPDTYNRFLTAK